MKPPKFDQFQYVKLNNKDVYGKIVSTAGWAVDPGVINNYFSIIDRNAPRSYIVRIDKEDLPKIGDYYKLYASPHKYYDSQKTSIRVSEDLLVGLNPLETLVLLS